MHRRKKTFIGFPVQGHSFQFLTTNINIGIIKKKTNYSPKTSALTTMLQLYIGVTSRCGWFWKAFRQPSLTVDIICPENGPYVWAAVAVSSLLTSIVHCSTTKHTPFIGSSHNGPANVAIWNPFKNELSTSHLTSFSVASDALVSFFACCQNDWCSKSLMFKRIFVPHFFGPTLHIRSTSDVADFTKAGQFDSLNAAANDACKSCRATLVRSGNAVIDVLDKA